MSKFKSLFIAGGMGVIVFLILMVLVRIESSFSPDSEGSMLSLLVMVVYMVPAFTIEYGLTSLLAGGVCTEVGGCEIFPMYVMWTLVALTAFFSGVIVYSLLRWAISRMRPESRLHKILSSDPGNRAPVITLSLAAISLMLFFALA